MPETRFTVRWPDGEKEECYSPSLVVKELLPAGQDYPIFEFMARSRAALTIASERVRLKYGFYCSAAQDQLRQLESRSKDFEETQVITVLDFRE